MKPMRWMVALLAVLCLGTAASAAVGPEEQYVLDKLAEAESYFVANNVPPEQQQVIREQYLAAAAIAHESDVAAAAEAEKLAKQTAVGAVGETSPDSPYSDADLTAGALRLPPEPTPSNTGQRPSGGR